MNFVFYIIIGAIAGWLAGKIMKGKGFGVILNIVIGIIGSVIGGWLFRVLNIKFFVVNSYVTWIIIALVGAIILLFIVNLFSGKKKR